MRSGCAAAFGDGDVEPLEVEIELDQRLARDIDRRPAIEGAVAERSGHAVDHDDRAVEPDLGLGQQWRLQGAGRVKRQLDRNVLPLHRRRGHCGLDLEFERLLAGARATGDLDLAIVANEGVGVDAVDATFHAVAQIGKHDRAVGHRHAIDRKRVSLAGG